MPVAGPAGRVVDRDIELRLDRARAVGRRFQPDRHGRLALRIGRRQRDLLLIGGKRLVHQADRVASQSGRRVGIDRQLQRGLTREVRGRRAVQEARGNWNRRVLLGHQRPGIGHLDSHAVRHERVDPEAGTPDRRQFGIGHYLDRPDPRGRRSSKRHRQVDRRLTQSLRHGVEQRLPVRTMDHDMGGQWRRRPGRVTQQRHHMHRLTRAIDAAIGPGERIERPGMRLPLDAAIGQVEGGRREIERHELRAGRRVNILRRQRTRAAQQGGTEPGDTVGIGRRLGQDVVAARQQRQVHARARQGVGKAADLDRQPVRAAPDAGGQVGPHHHLLRRNIAVGRAVARPYLHQVGARLTKHVR